MSGTLTRRRTRPVTTAQPLRLLGQALLTVAEACRDIRAAARAG
jgi:hypothetical protein